jgi:glycerol uptake facilitator protein
MKNKGLFGELTSEFLGTLILVLIGDGVVAMVVALGKGNWETITWAWGLAVVLGVYVAGGLSGAHINPAVTIALAVRGKFPWAKVGPYTLSQLAGAFVAAAILLLNYNPAITAFEAANNIVRGAASGTPGTAGIFSTFPNVAAGVGWGNALFDQVLGTAVLVCVLFAIIDKRNQAVESNLAPVVIGLLVVAIGMAIGGNAGYAINPARDLGPRILTAVGGWGANPFTYSADFFGSSLPYFLVPIIGPILGAIGGALVYDFSIHRFLVAKGEPEADVIVRGETVIDKNVAQTTA